MNLSQAWDRMFWAIMLTIFIGLVWMRFLQDVAACEGPGLLVALTAGVVFFATGFRRKSLAGTAHQEEEA